MVVDSSVHNRRGHGGSLIGLRRSPRRCRGVIRAALAASRCGVEAAMTLTADSRGRSQVPGKPERVTDDWGIICRMQAHADDAAPERRRRDDGRSFNGTVPYAVQQRTWLVPSGKGVFLEFWGLPRRSQKQSGVQSLRWCTGTLQ